MGTCRLAKLIVLEMWKKEVTKVDVEGVPWWPQARPLETKTLLMGRLEARIKEVKSRLEP